LAETSSVCPEPIFVLSYWHRSICNPFDSKHLAPAGARLLPPTAPTRGFCRWRWSCGTLLEPVV